MSGMMWRSLQRQSGSPDPSRTLAALQSSLLFGCPLQGLVGGMLPQELGFPGPATGVIWALRAQSGK